LLNNVFQAVGGSWFKCWFWAFSWKGECYQAIREKDGGARTQAMSRIMNTANVVVWIRICMGQLYLGRCFKGKPAECALAKSDAASTTNRLVRLLAPLLVLIAMSAQLWRPDDEHDESGSDTDSGKNDVCDVHRAIVPSPTP